MGCWITIPTYWGSRQAGIYDHPTPLDGRSTLPRLLDSLVGQTLNERPTILLILAATTPEEERPAYERLQELLLPYRNHLRLKIAGRAANALIQAAYPDLLPGDFNGYGRVRNLQLLLPAALGGEVIIALDDDEVVEPDFLQRATRWIGHEIDGRKVLGITGPYLDGTGSPYNPEPAGGTDIFKAKMVFMNRAFQALFEDPRPLPPTDLALGGNMVFHRDLFTRVPFDPWITRGEDIDYLINARLAGCRFYFDKELVITHLPPREYESPAYAKTRQDVLRFFYERAKIRSGGLKAADFDLYPGRFLGDDLQTQAEQALASRATPADVARWGKPAAILEEARALAQQVARYRQFQERWPSLVTELAADDPLRRQLAALITPP